MTISDKALLHVLRLLEESDSLAIEIEAGGMRLTARKGAAAAIPRADAGAEPEPNAEAAPPKPAPPAAEAAAPTDRPDAGPAEDGAAVVRSPMKGTFYRAPAPGEPPFCEAGDRVGADDTVCLVEIMKLFNSIPAGAAGTVERFFVENGEPVDLGQPIVSIRADRDRLPSATCPGA